MGRTLVISLILGASWPLVAQSDITTDIATKEQRSDIESVKIDSTSTRAIETARAEQWGLSHEDWQRYRSLMQGVRGSISPSTLSPIEVLGIHARNAAERRRYAERWAMMMREDAERILAFQHAYDEAHQRLFPQGQLIDTVKLAQHQSKTKTVPDEKLDSTGRVLFFTATNCVACDAILDRLLAKLPAIDGIDIYLLGVAPGDEDHIREWAGARRIKPDWVHERRVTLNVDAGVLDKFSLRLGDPLDQRPVVLRRRGDALLILSASRF